MASEAAQTAAAPEADEVLVPPVGDLTAGAAAAYVSDAAAPEDGPATSAAVDYADLLAVASSYLQTRLTYRYDHPGEYAAAVTAEAYSTPAFAHRSTPSSDQQARLVQAQESSSVSVGAPRPSGEAPTTPSAAYLTVACTVTTTYAGGSDTTDADWTLRLVLADGQWRVDGVLSTR